MQTANFEQINEDVDKVEKQTKPPDEIKSDSSAICEVQDPVVEVQNLYFSYGSQEALRDICVSIPKNNATAFIGPSGCGKSTLLRCFNRLNDLIDDCHIRGEIKINGENIYTSTVDITDLRKRVGMVFQKSNPFPKSIYENVAYGARIAGITKNEVVDEIVERSLKGAALWDEVKDRLNDNALGISGGQQQRLCIARAIAVEPEVLLMDEPCSALDPIATGKIEDLVTELKEKYTIVIVTHNMQQASRVSDYTAFMYLGELIEYDRTEKMFLNPSVKQTEDYVSGKFG